MNRNNEEWQSLLLPLILSLFVKHEEREKNQLKCDNYPFRVNVVMLFHPQYHFDAEPIEKEFAFLFEMRPHTGNIGKYLKFLQFSLCRQTF